MPSHTERAQYMCVFAYLAALQVALSILKLKRHNVMLQAQDDEYLKQLGFRRLVGSSYCNAKAAQLHAIESIVYKHEPL